MENEFEDESVWYFVFSNKTDANGKPGLLSLGNVPAHGRVSITINDAKDANEDSVLNFAKDLAVSSGFNKESRWHLSKIS